MRTRAGSEANGFSSGLQNPAIHNAPAAASGTYTVTVTAAGTAGLNWVSRP